MEQNTNLEGTPRAKALAENKKLSIILWIITGASLLIALVLGALESATGNETLSTISMIFGFVFFFAIVGAFLVINDKKRIRRSYCPYCGEHYDYETDVSWEVQDVVTSDNSQKANIEFVCECSNCGEETTFTQNFTISSFKNGEYVEKNIYVEAKKYFK